MSEGRRSPRLYVWEPNDRIQSRVSLACLVVIHSIKQLTLVEASFLLVLQGNTRHTKPLHNYTHTTQHTITTYLRVDVVGVAGQDIHVRAVGGEGDEGAVYRVYMC